MKPMTFVYWALFVTMGVVLAVLEIQQPCKARLTRMSGSLHC